MVVFSDWTKSRSAGGKKTRQNHRAKPVAPRDPATIKRCSECRMFIAAKKKELEKMFPGQIGWCRSRRIVPKPLCKMRVWDSTADMMGTSTVVDFEGTLRKLVEWNKLKLPQQKSKREVKVQWIDERGCPAWAAR